MPAPFFASRQAERDGCAFTEAACDLHGAAGLIDKAMHLREAETRTLADRLGGEERIKHFGDDVLRNARARIGDGDANIPALARAVVEDLILHRDSELAAPIHGIAGVENEVDERGLQLRLVGEHRPTSFRNIHGETDGAAKAALQHLGDGADRFVHIE